MKRRPQKKFISRKRHVSLVGAHTAATDKPIGRTKFNAHKEYIYDVHPPAKGIP
jgi:hypothetical protein